MCVTDTDTHVCIRAEVHGQKQKISVCLVFLDGGRAAGGSGLLVPGSLAVSSAAASRRRSPRLPRAVVGRVRASQPSGSEKKRPMSESDSSLLRLQRKRTTLSTLKNTLAGSCILVLKAFAPQLIFLTQVIVFHCDFISKRSLKDRNRFQRDNPNCSEKAREQ